MTPGLAQRIGELRRLTRALNLHVPPSYFSSSTIELPYEDSIRPILAREGTGPLHLYLGVPLCREHCRFCMYFYGLDDGEDGQAESCVRGLEGLLRAIRAEGRRPARIAASYIGGGTPTVMSAAQIGRLLAAVNAAFAFEPAAQRTFELSPHTATAAKIRAIVAGGYDRVSFGVQSFTPAVVAAAGRSFAGVALVSRLVEDCRVAGVSEVNVDLMVGLAGESGETLADSVRRLLATGCHTISIYRYRPERQAEMDQRGGMDAYVARCATRVAHAVEVAGNAGWSASGRVDGEHVRLLSSADARWPHRNLYETRFRPEMNNSLVGIGVASRSFLRNERMTSCPYRPRLGFELVGRPVLVELCDEASRVAAALVNGFFRDRTVDVATIASECGATPDAVFPAELRYLQDIGALTREGSCLTVAPAWYDEWPYLDKLLYPPAWLARRAEVTGRRIR